MTSATESEALSIMRTLYKQMDTQPMRWLVIESISGSDDTDAALQLAVVNGWLQVRPGRRKHEYRVYLTLTGRRMVENDGG